MRKNKKLIVLFVLTCVIVEIALVFLISHRELESFQAGSQFEHSQIEKNIATTYNFLNYMTIVAEDYFAQDVAQDGGVTSQIYDALSYDDGSDCYYKIVDAPSTESDFEGTVCGKGQVPVDKLILEEIGLAFELSAYFTSLKENNEDITWVYYVSESGFVYSSPSTTIEAIGDPEFYQSRDYYVNALPENNPDREIVWSSAYTDAMGQGEVVTVSIPIYDGDDFKGVIAVDRTVEDIKAIFQSNHATYLCASDGSVVASNTSINGEANNTDSPVNLEELGEIQNQSVVEGEVEYIDRCFTYAKTVGHTDWTYISIIPTSELILSSIVKTTPYLVAIVIFVLIYSYFRKQKNQALLKEENECLERVIADRTEEIRLTQEVTIEAITMLTESRDAETGNHIYRTKLFVEILAESLADTDKYREYMTPTKIKDMSVSAPLHDIGKIGISDSVLQKPGRLTDEEFSIMKTHTRIGADALVRASTKLGTSSFLDCAIEMTLGHHEKWDGTGYPYGLVGEEIPITARVMAVADVYDALRSERVYKAAMSHDEAYEIIISGTGKHFDPDVVEAFIKNTDKFREISWKYGD